MSRAAVAVMAMVAVLLVLSGCGKQKDAAVKDKDGGAADVMVMRDGSEMVLVPAGGAVIGSTEVRQNERPQARVDVPAFYIGKYEVTNAQYKRFVDETGYESEGNWGEYYADGQGEFPVVGVTWDDARAYCMWAGGRLPAEAEWEKAARGPEGRMWPWGDDWVDGYANTVESGAGERVAVGSGKDVSVYGAAGMCGNVTEWCSDWYAPGYGDSCREGVYARVAKGGNYDEMKELASPAARYPYLPYFRSNTVGFRMAADAVRSRPNVILISIDTLRADHLGCYGYGRNTSPNIDGFAREASLFEHAYSPVSWTAASHMSMLTSLYPSIHGVNEHWFPRRLRDGVKTLTERLKEEGYFTFGLYNHRDYLAPELGFDRGFDFYRQIEPTSEDSVRAAMSVLNNRGCDRRPFFMFFHVFDVHSPYMDLTVKKDPMYRDLYDPGYRGSVISGNSEELQAVTKRKNAGQDISRDLYHAVALYDGAINFTDKYIGQLFDGLKTMGLYDNSIIVFISDHGDSFQEHGVFGHMELQMETVHVPLIIRLPGRMDKEYGIRPGVRLPERVTTLDVMPTVLDLLGMKFEDFHQGVSLLPLLKGEKLLEPVVFGECEVDVRGYKAQRSAMDDSYLYIRLEGPMPPRTTPTISRLYDLKAGTSEKDDIASSRPDLVKHYGELIDAWEADEARIIAEKFPKDTRPDTIWKEKYYLKKKLKEQAGEKTNTAPVMDEGQKKRLERLKALGYIQ